MPTIRRSIYIGLGNTGVRAIAHTKKMFEDTFGKGNIPPQIVFLVLDFDVAELAVKDYQTDVAENIIPVPMHLSPLKEYKEGVAKGCYSWMLKENERAIPHLMVEGTRQVRSNGRLFAEISRDSITPALMRAFHNVMQYYHTADCEVSMDYNVDVHLVMSLAGGTGSGALLVVAQLLRELFPHNLNIIGHGVLPNVFRVYPKDDQISKLNANTYAAVLELDYLQMASVENPRCINIAGQTKTLVEPLFDEFYFVDNRTESGGMIEDINTLSGVIGRALYNFGCDTGDVARDFIYNCNWKYGQYNYKDKMGWAHRYGICEVVYKGDQLAQIYALEAKSTLVRKMVDVTSNAELDVLDWMEMTGIRERGDEYTVLSDRIYPADRISRLKQPCLDQDMNFDGPMLAQVLGRYLENYQDYPSADHLRSIFDDTTSVLREKVDHVMAGRGVADAAAFLQVLFRMCDLSKYELRDRCECLKSHALSKERNLECVCRQYLDYTHRIFRSRSQMQAWLHEIADCAREVLRLKIEQKRSEDAMEFFTLLRDHVEALHERMHALIHQLHHIEEESQKEALRLQLSGPSVFCELDVSYDERVNLAVDADDVSVSCFASFCGASLLNMSVPELNDALNAYAESLPRCSYYRDRLVYDVIEELPENAYHSLASAILMRVMPLVVLDRGWEYNINIDEELIVSFYNPYPDRPSRMWTDPAFSGLRRLDFVQSDSQYMRQRIVFHRIDAAFIPYRIKTLNDHAILSAYFQIIGGVSSVNARYNPHIDREIYEDMRQSRFTLKPCPFDFEMFLWICGQLFGWEEVQDKVRTMERDSAGKSVKVINRELVMHSRYINVDNGRYSFHIKTSGRWVKIHTRKRHYAYHFFKTRVFSHLYGSYIRLLKDSIASRGMSYYVSLANDIIAAGKMDYIDKVICSGRSSITYYATGNTPETDLIDKEWEFINEKLILALQYFEACI